MTKLENEKLTAADLAELIGISERRVRELAKDGTIKADAEGSFVLGPAIRAYTKRLRAFSEQPTLLAARRRKLEAEAHIAELRLAREQGTVMSVSQLMDLLTPGLQSARAAILQAEFPDADARDRVLEALSDTLDAALAKGQTAKAG